MKRINMIGKRYGRLVVVSEAERAQFPSCVVRQFNVRCDCGNGKIVFGGFLRRGNTQSCGCLHKERAAAANTTHGERSKGRRNSVEYRTWSNMISRCENPKTPSYEDYGGRGITVCDRWRDSFEAFLADMGRRPSPKLTIEREDNDRGYEPDNCVWATRSEQAFNRRPKKKAA